MITICQRRSTTVKTVPRWAGGSVDNGGGWVHVGPGYTWELSIHSPQFCREPKTALIVFVPVTNTEDWQKKKKTCVNTYFQIKTRQGKE